MNTNLIHNNITRYIAIFLFCLLPLKGVCQTGEETVDVLVGMGFENVGWHENDKERVCYGKCCISFKWGRTR